MLKTTILSAFFLSTAAFAMPQVGDQAVYDLTLTKDGQTYHAVGVEELVATDGSRFLQRETQKMDGQPEQVSENWKDASELVSDARADQMLAQCAQAGGSPATTTVPAGSFATCALDVNNQDEGGVPSGKVWLGKVPFGVVHAEVTQNGVTTLIDLRSFVEKQ